MRLKKPKTKRSKQNSIIENIKIKFWVREKFIENHFLN